VPPPVHPCCSPTPPPPPGVAGAEAAAGRGEGQQADGQGGEGEGEGEGEGANPPPPAEDSSLLCVSCHQADDNKLSFQLRFTEPEGECTRGGGG